MPRYFVELGSGLPGARKRRVEFELAYALTGDVIQADYVAAAIDQGLLEPGCEPYVEDAGPVKCESRDSHSGVPAGAVAPPVSSIHFRDRNGAPDGGCSQGVGFTISWQRGPLVVDGVFKEPNGAFVENVIKAAISRIEHYQDTRYACDENSRALGHLNAAVEELRSRTASRSARGVVGTSSV